MYMRYIALLILPMLFLCSSCESDEPQYPNQPEWIELDKTFDDSESIFFGTKQVPKNGVKILLQQRTGSDIFLIELRTDEEHGFSKVMTIGETSCYEYMKITFWADAKSVAPVFGISETCKDPYKYASIEIEPNSTQENRYFSIGIFSYDKKNKKHWGRVFNGIQSGFDNP